MTDTPTPIAEILPKTVAKLKEKGNSTQERIALTMAAHTKKDRSNGGAERLKPVQIKKGEVRNPRGNVNAYSMSRVRSLYAREGFSPEQIAKRMTQWLCLPYGQACDMMMDDKTELFERLGISILIHATESGDTNRLDRLLDRIIGPVIQHSTADVRTLSVTAKADVDLLTRIQSDLKQGKPVTLDNTTA